MQLKLYPDLLRLTQTNSTTTDIRARMQEVSTEAVTGLKADMTKGTNGDLGAAHLLQKGLNDIDRVKGLNTLSSVRLNLISSALSSSRESIDGLDTRMIIALSPGSTDLQRDTLGDEAGELLKSTIAALSSKHGTRHLFSGDQTQISPFGDPETLIADVKDILNTAASPAHAEAALDTYFNDPSGGYATNFYQGGTNPPPPLRYDSTGRIDLDITGQNQGIKDTLRGLAVLANSRAVNEGPNADSSTELLTGGAKTLSFGLAGLMRSEADLGIASKTISDSNDRLAAETQILSEAYTNVFGRDQFEAAGELKALQVQLEASYTITSRLSNLTLTNFLR